MNYLKFSLTTSNLGFFEKIHLFEEFVSVVQPELPVATSFEAIFKLQHFKTSQNVLDRDPHLSMRILICITAYYLDPDSAL